MLTVVADPGGDERLRLVSALLGVTVLKVERASDSRVGPYAFTPEAVRPRWQITHGDGTRVQTFTSDQVRIPEEARRLALRMGGELPAGFTRRTGRSVLRLLHEIVEANPASITARHAKEASE